MALCWRLIKSHSQVYNNERLGEVYDIGGHNDRNKIFIIKIIIEYIHDNVETFIMEEFVKHLGLKKGHERRYSIYSTKIKNVLK